MIYFEISLNNPKVEYPNPLLIDTVHVCTGGYFYSYLSLYLMATFTSRSISGLLSFSTESAVDGKVTWILRGWMELAALNLTRMRPHLRMPSCEIPSRLIIEELKILKNTKKPGT